MPNLTLYKQDIELIRDSLKLYAKTFQHIVDLELIGVSCGCEHEVSVIVELRDRLLSRLDHHLHEDAPSLKL